jgi:anaerobic magnesium-protoporphyrin IX monomethyl ester cyclase
VAYPLPGTKFYELVKEQMGAKRHWQESNDLEMMFHGTYTSDFYRTVRNLLHEQVTHPGTPALAERWNDLIEREAQFRHDQGQPALRTPLATAAAFG